MTSVKMTAAAQLEQEIREELTQRLAAENEALQSGIVAEGSPLLRITDDFEAVQYASHYPGGVWRGNGAAWIEGTRQAAAAGKGVFDRWTMELFRVAVRSETEVIACYELALHPADKSKRAGRAIFLELYVRGEDGWRLRRHTSEKFREGVALQ